MVGPQSMRDPRRDREAALHTSMTLAVMLLASAAPGAAQQSTLEYVARYDCQPGADHLMAVAALSGDRALVASNRGLTLVDLAALPPGGTSAYLFRLTGINARDVYLSDDEGHIFVNTHRGGSGNIGFDVVAIQGNSLQKVASVTEPGVLYEKMDLEGDLLYVAAHAFGLRIYDVSSPASPTLIGKLEAGFVDAFAVEVDGTRAHVADGGGGLKLVDVSDPTAPQLLDGEDLVGALGTSEDVTVRDGRVYVAAGGAGVAVYTVGDLGSRTLDPLPGSAESLCWVGDHLAVGSFSRTTVFEVGPGTQLTQVAFETAHRRGSSARLRLAEGLGAAPGERLLVAGWNFMDVYALKPSAAGTQPDIVCDTQRIRFDPSGATRQVTVTNNGQGTLVVSQVSVTSPDFAAAWSGGSLAPGASVSFDVTYQGGPTNTGSGVVLLGSNDPDENPLPIQVFGNTTFLDPGEPAVDFTLQTLERDAQTGQVVQGAPFSLSGQLGKIVWFAVFGTW